MVCEASEAATRVEKGLKWNVVNIGWPCEWATRGRWRRWSEREKVEMKIQDAGKGNREDDLRF